MISLYPYLILVGTTILLVMAFLLRQARRQSRVHLELVHLNQSLHFDLPDFLRNCWPQLARAGFTGLSWRSDWFDTPLAGSEGATDEGILCRQLKAGKISLDVCLYHHKHRWERRYFSEALAENFFLLLHVDMWIKTGAVQGAFDQTAKLGLFLQHDVKNIAQFIRLATDQLANAAPEHETRLLATLRTAMPAVRLQAEHILEMLSCSAETGQKRVWQLAEVWQQAADMHRLAVDIQGLATTILVKETLHGIIDNLLANYVDQAFRFPDNPPSLRIILHQEGGKATATIQDIHGSPCVRPERLFEPFWSEQGEGMGIGLYQARQLATKAGGALEILAPTNQPLTFILTLPGPL